MELKDFVTNTLVQIAEGVRNASEAYTRAGGDVMPSGFLQVEGGIPYGKTTPIDGEASLLCNVAFDVTLTSENTTNNSGGIGVLFGAVSIGGKSGGEEREVSLTRVKFNVPVVLPTR